MNIVLMETAKRFLDSLPKKHQNKVYYNLNVVSAGSKDPRLFKKLEGHDIWEFRTEYEGYAYRLLAFWDKQRRSMVVATHGFHKKSQKTPPKEIERAIKLRNEYYKGKTI